MKTMTFNSQADYEAWADTFETPSEYSRIPVLIDDGFTVSADMETECKSWKTAVRRFAKAFCNISAFDGWIGEDMLENGESGIFQDMSKYYGTPEEIAEFRKNGQYSWGIEEVSDGVWYIYVNVSSVYAGRSKAETETGGDGARDDSATHDHLQIKKGDYKMKKKAKIDRAEYHYNMAYIRQ